MNNNKPTWVFTAGSYRTGSTTQYRMVRDIVEETDNGVGIGYHNRNKLRDYDKPTHRYVVCKVFIYLPDECPIGATLLRENRILATMTLRDPRDIITSIRKRHNDYFSEPLPFHDRVTAKLPRWLSDVDKWIDGLGDLCYISRYERWIHDILQEVHNLASFLDIDLSDDLARTIANRHTINGIRKYKAEMKEKNEREDPFLPSIPNILFGTSGIYKERLTADEEQLLIEHNGDLMRLWGYL